MNRIAEDMGWCTQTITDELRNRRVDIDKRYGCSNRLCAHYEECRIESYTATGKGLRKNQPKCFETCPNFSEEVCHRLARPPFVCNGCAKEHNCPMRKKYYIPEAAQAYFKVPSYVTFYKFLRKLIRDQDLTNALVCADALHGQQETARAILDANGDYLLQIKENQPNLAASPRARQTEVLALRRH